MIGLAMGAIGLFSQKSIYQGGAMGLGWLLLVLAQWRPVRWTERARTAGIAVGSAIGFVALWYGLMLVLNWDGNAFVERQMSAAATTAFANPPSVDSKLKSIGTAVQRAPVLYYLGGAGAATALPLAKRNPRQFAALGLAAGMASTIFWHRGFFMYYIASMEPYLAVLAGGFVHPENNNFLFV